MVLRVNRRVEDRLPEGKRKLHSHSPFTLEDPDGAKISCSVEGRVTFRKEEKGTDPEDGSELVEEHEIEVSASTIFQIANMLNVTRKTKIVDKDRK